MFHIGTISTGGRYDGGGLEKGGKAKGEIVRRFRGTALKRGLFSADGEGHGQ